MNVWHDLNPGDLPTESFKCLIEIPAKSHNKYEIDKDSGLLMLDRVLNSSVMYPTDYGMIPQTLAEDGDPLDVLLLATNPLPPMCLVEARPIGMMMMIDDGEADEKIIAVPTEDPRWAEVKSLDDIPRARLAEIEDFFRTYKYLEKKSDKFNEVASQKVEGQSKKILFGVKGHKKPIVEGYQNLSRAKEVIQECLDRYKQKYGA